MEAALRCCNALLGAEARWTADDYRVHRMRKTPLEAGVRLRLKLLAQPMHLLFICAVNGGQFDAGDLARGASMSVADIPGAEQSDADAHALSAPTCLSSCFIPAQLCRVDSSGVPPPRQCVSRLTAYLYPSAFSALNWPAQSILPFPIAAQTHLPLAFLTASLQWQCPMRSLGSRL